MSDAKSSQTSTTHSGQGSKDTAAPFESVFSDPVPTGTDTGNANTEAAAEQPDESSQPTDEQQPLMAEVRARAEAEAEAEAKRKAKADAANREVLANISAMRNRRGTPPVTPSVQAPLPVQPPRPIILSRSPSLGQLSQVSLDSPPPADNNDFLYWNGIIALLVLMVLAIVVGFTTPVTLLPAAAIAGAAYCGAMNLLMHTSSWKKLEAENPGLAKKLAAGLGLFGVLLAVACPALAALGWFGILPASGNITAAVCSTVSLATAADTAYVGADHYYDDKERQERQELDQELEKAEKEKRAREAAAQIARDLVLAASPAVDGTRLEQDETQVRGGLYDTGTFLPSQLDSQTAIYENDERGNDPGKQSEQPITDAVIGGPPR